MTRPVRFGGLLALVLFPLCEAGLLAASPSPAQTSFNNVGADDLTARLLQSKIHQPEIYARAITVLESQRTMPGCHRLAMSNLMDSCQSLERERDVEVELAEVREIFATRLAMCELSGAQATPPAECLPFVQSQSGCRKRSFMGYFREDSSHSGNGQICFPEVSHGQLRSCLKVLNGRPQLWTSYSNNLQNVLTVCHASRNAVEIEDILSIHRSSTDTTKDLTKALAESLSQTTDFISSMKAFHEQSMKELDSQIDSSKSLFSHLIAKLQIGVHSLLDAIQVGSTEALQGLKHINTGLDQVSNRINATDVLFMALLSALEAQSSDAQNTHKTSLDLITTRTEEVDQNLQLLIQSNMHTLSKFLDFHMAHLQNFTAAVEQGSVALGHQLDENNKRLEKQDGILDGRELGTNYLFKLVVLAGAVCHIVNTWKAIIWPLLLIFFFGYAFAWWLLPDWAKVSVISAISTMSFMPHMPAVEQIDGLSPEFPHRAETWIIFVVGITLLGILAGLAGFFIARRMERSAMLKDHDILDKHQALGLPLGGPQRPIHWTKRVTLWTK